MNYKTYNQNDADYPKRLLSIHDPPKQLLVRGQLPAEEAPTVAIVGSRRPTGYGRVVTEELSRRLAVRGVVVVSGLAMGIDGLAHQAAVAAKGLTVAVLPCGIDRIYPKSNRGLAEGILNSGGALVTEYPPGTEAAPYHFPARNRIVAGLADVVVIIEAGEQSGSLITANLALDRGTPIFAVPGPITSAVSRGTNQLIVDGALPLTAIEDLLQFLHLEAPPPDKLRLSPKQQRIVDIVSHQPSSTHQLSRILNLETAQLQQLLTELELSGLLTERSGLYYASLTCAG